jgi:hypothetical protein
MKHVNWIAGAALALSLALSARAEHAPSRMLEGAIETYTNEITLPASAGGTILVRHCERCGGVSLTTSAATRYFIGSRSVSLQDLIAYLRSGQRFPTTIFYNLGDGSVSRVAAGK